MSKRDKNDRGSDTDDTGLEGNKAWGAQQTEQNGSASGSSSANASSLDPDPIASTATGDKDTSSGGPKDETPPASSVNNLVLTHPSDRRVEQAILNSTPLPGVTSPPDVDEKTGEKTYRDSNHRLSHVLERARDAFLERNMHVQQPSLFQEIEQALAEVSGSKQREPFKQPGEQGSQPSTSPATP